MGGGGTETKGRIAAKQAPPLLRDTTPITRREEAIAHTRNMINAMKKSDTVQDTVNEQEKIELLPNDCYYDLAIAERRSNGEEAIDRECFCMRFYSITDCTIGYLSIKTKDPPFVSLYVWKDRRSGLQSALDPENFQSRGSFSASHLFESDCATMTMR